MDAQNGKAGAERERLERALQDNKRRLSLVRLAMFTVGMMTNEELRQSTRAHRA